MPLEIKMKVKMSTPSILVESCHRVNPGDPVAEGSSQFCKIYLQRHNQMLKVNIREMSQCSSGEAGEFQIGKEV